MKLDKANIKYGQSMNFFQTLKQSQRPMVEKIYIRETKNKADKDSQ